MSDIRTCEFVSPKHPDKLCDILADTILDAFLTKDPHARVAVEVMGGHGLLTLNGEVTSHSALDIQALTKKFLTSQGYPSMEVQVNLSRQSLEIARGVDTGGAGDQGIMSGYACGETSAFMPLEYETARTLCRKLYERWPYDGKTQVTVEGKRVKSVVASFQNALKTELEQAVRSLIDADEYHINPAGDWSIGGFDADSGLSGRKLIVDNYGPQIPIGGGSFSGKDPTKVDRSAAYMARRIAVDLLKKHHAKRVLVKLAYAIGVAEPVMAVADVDSRTFPVTGYNLTPEGIIQFLDLRTPRYAQRARWGHF